MLKLITGERVVYSTTLDLSSILWITNLDSDELGLFSFSTRLSLYTAFGYVALFDAKRMVFLHRDSGHCQGHVDYDFERVLPELESVSEHTSPYAQTGFCIWDLQCFQDGLTIVHDVERCSPTIVDVIRVFK